MKSLKARATQLLPWPLVTALLGHRESAQDRIARLATPSLHGESGTAQQLDSSTPDSIVSSSRQSIPPRTVAKRPPRPPRMHFTAKHDRRILLMAIAAGFPAVLVALILLWDGAY
ncbi:MAG: hypothetical protein WAV20_22680, partial [Blastocatellia bacterium]